MKYFVAIVLGFAVGAALALAAMYYNPLTGEVTRPLPAGGWTFSYGYPDAGSLLVTHRGMKGLPLQPAGVARLWEDALDASVLNVMTLSGRDEAPAAVATRLAMPSTRTDLLRRGAIVSDYWLVTVPGQGTFFAHSDDNLWPFLKETFLPVMLQRDWQGPTTYRPTAGPGLGRLAAVYGASGRFAGMQGTAAETYQLQAFGREQGVQRLQGELHVYFDPDTPLAAR